MGLGFPITWSTGTILYSAVVHGGVIIASVGMSTQLSRDTKE